MSSSECKLMRWPRRNPQELTQSFKDEKGSVRNLRRRCDAAPTRGTSKPRSTEMIRARVWWSAVWTFLRNALPLVV